MPIKTPSSSDLEKESEIAQDPRWTAAFEAFRHDRYAKTGQALLDTRDPAAVHLDLYRDENDAVHPEALERCFFLYPDGGVIEEREDTYHLHIETQEYEAPKTEEGQEILEAILYDYLYQVPPDSGLSP